MGDLFLKFIKWGTIGLTAGGVLSFMFSRNYGGNYGTTYHRLQHYFNSSGGGTIGHIQLNDGRKVHGLICRTCGFVNINRVMDADDSVDTMGFAWSKG